MTVHRRRAGRAPFRSGTGGEVDLEAIDAGVVWAAGSVICDGDNERATPWLNRCLAYPENNEARTASVHFVLALMDEALLLLGK